MNEDGCVCACKSESLCLFHFIFKRNSSKNQDSCGNVRCDLTTHSTILSHVGILVMLSWNFTGKVLSNCRLFDYLIYNCTPQSTNMVMSVRCYRYMEFLPTDIWMSCQSRCALNYIKPPKQTTKALHV